MKNVFLFALLLFLPACSHFDIVQYQPNPNDNQPERTIERVLKEQPPSWGNVPYSVSVKDDCIEMRTLKEGGPPGLPMLTTSADTLLVIYYKHIGKTVLHKHSSGVWYVEIIDRAGQWMHSVNCYEEADAKAFIDALYTMKRR